VGPFAELFRPNEGYPYFQHADRYPFDAGSTHFSPVNAAWLADCALLVYLREGTQVAERLEGTGLSGVCLGFERPGAQAFVAHSDDWAVVSFRGTEVREWQDVVASALFKLVPRPPHEGNIHLGFHRALESIWPEIEEVLSDIQGGRRTPVPVWFTGHSLGAAMATLAADAYEGARALYTFGSPRVGDKRFRRGLAVNAYRIVNDNDGITSVPPGPPLSPYRHVGDLKYLDGDGNLSDDPRSWTRFKGGLTGHLRALQDAVGDFIRGDLDQVEFDQLSDHSPTLYASALWQVVRG